MLEWKRVDGSWFGNGFRVKQVAPTLWSLEHADQAVSVDVTGPIAQLHSLDACKYKAEELHEGERVAKQRRWLGAVGAGGWALAVLAGNPLGFIVGGVIGSAALLELVASWFEGRVGFAAEYKQ